MTLDAINAGGRITPGLHKTVIVVWSEYPTDDMELEALARDATEGTAYCSKITCEYKPDPAADPDWDGTEFFEEV